MEDLFMSLDVGVIGFYVLDKTWAEAEGESLYIR
jgi:hypothetical protein